MVARGDIRAIRSTSSFDNSRFVSLTISLHPIFRLGTLVAIERASWVVPVIPRILTTLRASPGSMWSITVPFLIRRTSSPSFSEDSVVSLQHLHEHRHPYRYSVLRLLEVPGMRGRIHPGIDLVHPRQGVEDDQVLFGTSQKFR